MYEINALFLVYTQETIVLAMKGYKLEKPPGYKILIYFHTPLQYAFTHQRQKRQ